MHHVAGFFEVTNQPAPSPASLAIDPLCTAILQPLAEQQEPLGAEFDAVWDANAAELYES